MKLKLSRRGIFAEARTENEFVVDEEQTEEDAAASQGYLWELQMWSLDLISSYYTPMAEGRGTATQ